MTETTTTCLPDEDPSDSSPISERCQQFRLSTELPVEILWRDDHGLEHQDSAVLREISARECRIDTSKCLNARLPVTVRIGTNYLVCLVRDFELALNGFTIEMLILPTKNGTALLGGLERMMSATSYSQTPAYRPL